MFLRFGSFAWPMFSVIAYGALFAVWPGFSGVDLPLWLRPVGQQAVKWYLVLGYAGLGVLLLGGMTRLFLTRSFHWLRLMMVLFGATLAFLHTLAFSMRHKLELPMEYWLMGVLGLAAVAMLARLLPPGLAYFWLGRDREY